MNSRRKFTSKSIYAFPLAMLIILTLSASANYKSPCFFYKSLTAFQDTTRPLRADTTRPGRASEARRVADSLRRLKGDTTPITRTDTLDFRVSKDSLDAPVSYSASDSVVLDVPAKTITLYSKATTKYKDLDLTGSIITLDQPRRLVTATYTRDSLGNIVDLPKFVQGENNFTADTIV